MMVVLMMVVLMMVVLMMVVLMMMVTMVQMALLPVTQVISTYGICKTCNQPACSTRWQHASHRGNFSCEYHSS